MKQTTLLEKSFLLALYSPTDVHQPHLITTFDERDMYLKRLDALPTSRFQFTTSNTPSNRQKNGSNNDTPHATEFLAPIEPST
ncbi:unnamed protein product [Caenorhabditis nigoni]